jgi:hypothetical protein
MLFNALQCSSMLFNALQCSSMLFNALQCSLMLFNALSSALEWAPFGKYYPADSSYGSNGMSISALLPFGMFRKRLTASGSVAPVRLVPVVYLTGATLASHLSPLTSRLQPASTLYSPSPWLWYTPRCISALCTLANLYGSGGRQLSSMAHTTVPRWCCRW